MQICFDRVTFRYDESTAVRDVSLRLPSGGIVSIVGPAAAGKSTLLRLIEGTQIPTRGTIRLGDQRKQPISTLVFFAEPSASTASCRSPEVSVVLVDDLLGHPDFLTATTRRAYVTQQRKDGRIVVYATRDAEDAMAISDHIAVFVAGALVQADTASRIYDAPTNEFVATFFGRPRINLIPAILEKDGQAILIGNQTVSLAGRIAEEFCRDITVGVRPQHVTLRAEPSGWRGRVVSSEAVDDNHSVVVDVEGVCIRALTPKVYRQNDTVFVRILPKHYVVFDDRGVRLEQL